MAVYIGKDGTRYVGSMAERKKAEDAKKSTTSSGSSSNSGNASNTNVGSTISRGGSTSGTTSGTTSNVGSAISRDGSSGGGTSNYSPYASSNLGSTWDADTDYAAIIDKAVANGDYITAAQAERFRNEKINALGLDYTTTNRFSGWLDSTDYATIGTNQMANGASWEEVQDTYNKRYAKANGTEGLQQYADDDFQRMMLSYINQQKALEEREAYIDEWEQDNQRPDTPQSDPRIDAILNEILNREDFSYDAMSDPLYQQYADMYRREGDRAMKETMAEAAAGAGGMNTYAITAAQQANSYYNSQLNDKIPELYQLAYQMYLQDKESMVQDLGILQGMDDRQYNRYRDTINDYYADKNFAYGVYQDAVQQGNWQTSFNNDYYWKNKEFDYNDMWTNKQWDYNVGRDAIADDRYEEQWDYNVGRDAIDDSRYDTESAKEEVWRLIGLGVTPSADLIKRAGMSETDVNLAVAAVKAQQAPSTTSYTRQTTPAYDPEDISTEDDVVEPVASTEITYETANQECARIYAEDGKDAVMDYIEGLKQSGVLTASEYFRLVQQYYNKR